MAMPTSGTIGLKFCQGAIACSSICVAVGGTDGSLTSYSVLAGKSAPHCMSEFYGYVPKIAINWCQYFDSGGQGINSYVYKRFCTYPLPAAGQTYSLCVKGDLSLANQATSSYTYICVTCNGLSKMCCRITIPSTCATPTVLMTVDSNDVVCALVLACATNTACSLCARGTACIFSVTGTYHCKGSTCSVGFTYTA